MLLDRPEFCTQILCSRNRNSMPKNGHSALRKWKLFPMPWQVDFPQFFHTKSCNSTHFHVAVLKSKSRAKFRNHGILEGLFKRSYPGYLSWCTKSLPIKSKIMPICTKTNHLLCHLLTEYTYICPGLHISDFVSASQSIQPSSDNAAIFYVLPLC